MLNVDRQKMMLDILYKKGSVKVSELSQQFGVHEETVRRDLKALAAQWKIELVYGGAFIRDADRNTSVSELNLAFKRNQNYEEKQIIAQKAASLIQPGDTIGVNNGSTVEYILDYLSGKTPINLVTINVHLAAKASLTDGVSVFLPGGKVRQSSGSLVGKDIMDFISQFSIDKCFFGTSAISLHRGITHPVLEEVESNQRLASVSSKVYIVSDSSKLDKTSLIKMLDIDDVDAFITDGQFTEEYLNYMKLHNIAVI